MAEKRQEELASDDTNSADAMLASLGYTPELLRNRSTFHVAFMSFVLASIPYGLSTTMYYSLANGGPVTVVWGWVLVSFLTLCVAVSLAEIVSVLVTFANELCLRSYCNNVNSFPCAGGVYYQTYMLSAPSYRKLTSWITGWAFVVGNITITLAVQFGTALFYVACIQLFGDYFTETYQIYLLFVAITVLCSCISTFGNRYLPILDTFAVFWTFAGVIALVITVLVLAKGGRRSASFAFGEYDTSNSGWPTGWSFFVGLLQAAYATSSTGMLVSMCEEVAQPETQVPRAMVATIGINFVAGFLFLVPLMFVLPNLVDVLAVPSGQPVPTIVLEAVGSTGGAFALMIPIMVLGILCGVACQTAATRCTWAFARDGAIPGHKLWSKVNKRFELPLNAMILVTVVQILIGLIYFGSTQAFNAFSGCGVISLGLSYLMPILVSFLRGREAVKRGKFYCGILGKIANIISICWFTLAIPLFCLPSVRPVTAISMNYASVCAVFFVVVSAVYYYVGGRKHFKGPPVDSDPAIVATASTNTALYTEDRGDPKKQHLL